MTALEDPDETVITPIDQKPTFGGKIKAAVNDFVPIPNVIDIEEVQFKVTDSPRMQQESELSSHRAPMPNWTPARESATARMDALLAQMSAGRKSADGGFHFQKPEFARVGPNHVGHNLNYGQKPEFKNMKLERSQNINQNDISTVNMEGPGSMMSPSGSDGSFLHNPFEPRTIIATGQGHEIPAGLQSDMSAIMPQIDDDSLIINGAFRRSQIQSFVPLRAGLEVIETESESQFRLDSEAKKNGLLSPADIKLYMKSMDSPSSSVGGVDLEQAKTQTFKIPHIIEEETKTIQQAQAQSEIAAVASDAEISQNQKGGWSCCSKKSQASGTKTRSATKAQPPQPYHAAPAPSKSPVVTSTTNSKKQSGLSEIPEERPGEDSTPQNINSNDLNETDRILLSPPFESGKKKSAAGFIEVADVYASPKVDTGKVKQKGSMTGIKKYKPDSLKRSNSEALFEKQRFFTCEDSPRNSIKRSLKGIENFERKHDIHKVKKSLEVQKNKKEQINSIFSSKPIIFLAYFLRVIGVLILSINLIVDTSYVFLSKFAGMGVLGLYLLALAVRYLIPIIGVICNCMYKVNLPIEDGVTNDALSTRSANTAKQVKEEADYVKHGYFLYGALPFSFLVGTHRLINFKNGSSEMGTGLLIDFFLSAVTFLILQTLNHGYLSTEATDNGIVYDFSDLQSAAIVFKFALMMQLFVEFILYIIELYFFNKFMTRRRFAKQKFALSEKSKRQRFGTRYALVNANWTAICFIVTLIITLSFDAQTCRLDQTVSNLNDLVCIECAVENCGACSVSGHELCDICKPGFYMIDNKECIDSKCQIDQCETCESQGPRSCDKCAEGFFLSDSGHCQSKTCLDPYCFQCTQYGDGICDLCFQDFKFNKYADKCEFAPCEHLNNCKTCEAESIQCLNCLTNYLIDPFSQNCVVDMNCSVQGCRTCRKSSVCDKCETGLWLDLPANKCIDSKCQINNCETCNTQGPTVCEKCETGFVLIEGSGICKSTTCEPGFVFSLQTNECEDKRCKVENCQLCEVSGIETCDRCQDNYWLTSSNTCIDSTCQDSGCGICNTEGPTVCNTCKSDYVLLDSTKKCKSKVCLAGSKWNDALLSCEDVTCKLANCRNCETSGIQSCDVCEAGYFFDSAKGTCELDVCQVEHCMTCESDRNICEACSATFWLDTSSNTCIDATCQDSNCKSCSTQGPTICDLCEDNFQLYQNECRNTLCTQVGYEFSFQTFQCEDTICKVKNCQKCDISGLEKCEKCEKGFVYEEILNVCVLDDTCGIKYCADCGTDLAVCNDCINGFEFKSGTCVKTACTGSSCAKCDLSPELCEECATGFWHQKNTWSCIDATCLVEKCETCNIQGPTICDLCQSGYLMYDNKCLSTTCPAGFRFELETGLCIDTVCKVDNCKNCVESGIQLCDECDAEFLVNTDKTKCDPDTSCRTLFCDKCEASRESCEGCAPGFWLNQDTQKCIDATCHVSDCKTCDLLGPTTCDACKLGFFLLENVCVSTTCPNEYEFNEETGRCEDTVCKIDGCDTCSVSGIYDCDKCQSDFIYEKWQKRCVKDTTCRVQGCAECTNDRDKCEKCVPGLWYNAELNACGDGTCQVKGCADCSTLGPTKCDTCSQGFRKLDDVTCVACQTDGCSDCSTEAATCEKCEDGRTLQNGRCSGCSPNLCLSCDDVQGTCTRCKPGHFLEEDGMTCTPCANGCAECGSLESCLQCDPIKHIRIFPVGGKCFCDTTKGWFEDKNTVNDCICQSEWLTADGDCTNCATAFPGCITCEKISTTDKEAFTGGIQVDFNPFSPATVAGSYICKECSVAATFFNYDAGFCMRCDRDVSGCKTCGSDGSCIACHSQFALQDTGGCYPCEWHSTGCETCTVDQCLACGPNYLKVAGFCWPIPF